jgi:glutamate-ammonia-ligase adenylyltransferase
MSDVDIDLAVNDRIQDLLLGKLQIDDELRPLLASAGFADWRAAQRCLGRMADDARTRRTLSYLLPQLLMTLAGAANPDRVLVCLDRFVQRVPDKVALLHYLADNPRALEILVTLFAGSQYLTEILLRNPEYFERLIQYKRLAQPKSAEQLFREARGISTSSFPIADQLDALRCFQRWELLRIGTCDLLDLFDLPTVTAQLSNLADSMVRASMTIAAAKSGTALDGFVVIGLGKLGGGELNYSSDIDLLFLAGTDATDYRRLGERLIDALARTTDEGFLYRVDMRLRPWGNSGALVSSLNGYMTYLRKHARLWERQALLKARVIAGDATVGDEFMRRVEPL